MVQCHRHLSGVDGLMMVMQAQTEVVVVVLLLPLLPLTARMLLVHPCRSVRL